MAHSFLVGLTVGSCVMCDAHAFSSASCADRMLGCQQLEKYEPFHDQLVPSISRSPLMQAATLADLLSQDDATAVLQHAFLEAFKFCERAEAELVQPAISAAHKRLECALRGEPQTLCSLLTLSTYHSM